MPDPVIVKLFKASRVANLDVPDLRIEAHDEFPETNAEACRGLHRNNARRLGDALIASLPGGTIDQLLVFLLEHQASVLRVPHPRPEGSPRYYLEIEEDGHRLPAGDRRGYATLTEAEEAAKRHVDDALPRNNVRVYAHVTTAHLGSDDVPYVSTTP